MLDTIIPEPRFVVACYISLADLEARLCQDDATPSQTHLKAEIHLNTYNVPSDLPWRLVVGWRSHEPVRITAETSRSVSPITSGSSEVYSGDWVAFAQLVQNERFIDANSGLILRDFEHLLVTLAGYLHRRVMEKQPA